MLILENLSRYAVVLIIGNLGFGMTRPPFAGINETMGTFIAHNIELVKAEEVLTLNCHPHGEIFRVKRTVILMPERIVIQVDMFNKADLCMFQDMEK